MKRKKYIQKEEKVIFDTVYNNIKYKKSSKPKIRHKGSDKKDILNKPDKSE